MSFSRHLDRVSVTPMESTALEQLVPGGVGEMSPHTLSRSGARARNSGTARAVGTSVLPQRPVLLRNRALMGLVLLWGALAVVTVAIFVTYTRTPVQELYHVRHGGPGEGLARALAFVGFPCGLIALATLPVVLQQLSRLTLAIGAAAAALLTAGVLWPDALDEAGLEARPGRILAALGVTVVVLLTAVALRTRSTERLGRRPWDRARIVIGALVAFAALPWLAADIGVSLDGVPGLRSLFLTGVLAHQPDRPGLHPAVHIGHHHGMTGVLLVLAALLLSRTLDRVRSRALRIANGLCLSFMIVYGLANAAQDFWLEQIVKRGLTTTELPMMLTPSRQPVWALLAVLTVALFLACSWIVGHGRARRTVGQSSGDESGRTLPVRRQRVALPLLAATVLAFGGIVVSRPATASPAALPALAAETGPVPPVRLLEHWRSALPLRRRRAARRDPAPSRQGRVARTMRLPRDLSGRA